MERRKERLLFEPDFELQSFDLSGEGGPFTPVDGKVTATEVFGEARVPLIEGRRFADLLSVNGSYRLSRYNTVQNYRFRGSYQRAVRAANIVELFQPQGNNLFDMAADPCGPSMTATFAQCQRSGITAAQYGSAILDSPAGQYNTLQGGNTTLRPERSDSYTAGLVFTPIRNLTGTIDWWSIKIDGAIDAPPPEQVLNQCLFNNVGCNLIQRDAIGTLWAQPVGRVTALNSNIGGYHTTGIDVAVNYLFRMGSWGSLNLNAIGTRLSKWEQEPIKGLGKYDCAGLYGNNCVNVYPKWRHKIRATWTTPWNLDLALTWRHIASVEEETTSSNPLLNDVTFDVERKFAKRDYIDLAASWTVDKSLTVRAGVNNLLDKDPPLVGSGAAGPTTQSNGNTFPQTYDALGRLVFVSATLKW